MAYHGLAARREYNGILCCNGVTGIMGIIRRSGKTDKKPRIRIKETISMSPFIQDLLRKRDRLNNRLGVVRSFNALRSIRRELDSVDELLRLLGED
jgi:hypothetical protein